LPDNRPIYLDSFSSTGAHDVPRIRPKRAVIIAGPNGAGKTTFAREFLPREAEVLSFVNADLIAAGLSLEPERAAVRAGRIMVQTIREHVVRGEDFAFETTLSGRRDARSIPVWQAAGYRVGLIFISLPSPEVAIARVASRVSRGGHFVPDEVVRRRFLAGRVNFESVYKPLVNFWRLLDNGGSRPVLVDEGGAG
jgi:predicted ABC-type ATPase